MRHAHPILVHSIVLLLLTFSALSGRAQVTPAGIPANTAGAAEQMASDLEIDPLLRKLQTSQSSRPCGSPTTMDELALRQQMLESVVATSLEVDGVLAEIANERTDLSEVRAGLQARRDRTVGLLNAANLITGTGLGIAVNAMQFNASTANLGDGIGVGSGIASTVLSLIGIRKQGGAQHGVGAVPNMLAPLFDETPALNTYYPPPVLHYLNSVPAGEDPTRGTRLNQLMAEWTQGGRLLPSDSSKREKKIVALTTGMNKKVKLSISDLTDRSAMLGDVSGRVALMKRDMAAMMRSLGTGEASCRP